MSSEPTTTTVPSTTWASSGNSTFVVTPLMVSSPIADTETGSPVLAALPSSMGSVIVNEAVGNDEVSSASCTLSSRRLSSVVIVVRSTSSLPR